MAKKGISLNPGSDATLVAAATRAALANVPQDLSSTFEKRAESYDAMMSNIAEGYSEGIKQLVTLGKSVAKDAIASNQQIAIGKNFVIGKREIKEITDEPIGVKKLAPSLVAVKETAYAPALNDIIDGKTPTTKEGIKKLQKALVDADFNIGNFGPNKDGVDGKLGEKTQAAIDRFKLGHKKYTEDKQKEEQQPIIKNPNENVKDKEIGVTSVATPTFDKIEQDLKASQESKASQKTEQEPMTIGSELKRIRKELRGIGAFGIALTEEDIRKKYDLQQQKDQLISDLNVLNNAENFSNESLTNGSVDLKATGALNLVAKRALTAYQTKTGVIEDGEYKGYKAELARNNNDELVFRLVAPDNSYVTGLDLNGKLTTNTMNINAGDEPYSIPVKNLNSILSKNITTAEIDDVDKLFRGEMTSKNTSYAGNLLVNRFEKYLQTEDNLHGFMNKRLGDHPSTFVEDMNNPSVLSATIVNSMDNLKDIPGVEDANNDNKITDQDFLGDGKNPEQLKVAVNNFKIIKQAILDKNSKNYNEQTTREIFLDYAKGIGNDMYKYSPGYKASIKPSGPSDPSDPTDPIDKGGLPEGFVKAFPTGTNYGTVENKDGSKTSITGDTFKNVYTKLASGEVKSVNGTWKLTDGVWVLNNKFTDETVKSKDEFLRFIQPPAGPSLMESTYFEEFRGGYPEGYGFQLGASGR
jgi:hypothetical protein